MKTKPVTGASGVSGSDLSAHMSTAGRRVIATDISPVLDPQGVVEADLSMLLLWTTLSTASTEACTFGAISKEQKWDMMQSAKIEGTCNIVESVRKDGIRRVNFLSNYHVIGFHPMVDAPICLDAPVRPDMIPVSAGNRWRYPGTTLPSLRKLRSILTNW